MLNIPLFNSVLLAFHIFMWLRKLALVATRWGIALSFYNEESVGGAEGVLGGQDMFFMKVSKPSKPSKLSNTSKPGKLSKLSKLSKQC